MLSDAQVKDVCLRDSNQRYQQCQYLMVDTFNYKVCHCMKNTSSRKSIEKDTEKFINDCLYLHIDPKNQGYPIGDNCQGFLPFKHVLQGYDVE